MSGVRPATYTDLLIRYNDPFSRGYATIGLDGWIALRHLYDAEWAKRGLLRSP